MSRYRSHLIVLVLSWILFIVFGSYSAGEAIRMQQADDRQTKESIERGLELYARNCTTCHGPMGEGCIGLRLNRPDYHNKPEKLKNVAYMLKQTITDGRPGTGVPSWVRVKDKDGVERWASYTAMPAWHQDKGGPLNEMHIRDLVNFLMMGEFSQVLAKVKEMEAVTNKAMMEAKEPKDPMKLTMVEGKGLTPAENERGQRLFTEKGCIGCHRIGQRGSSVAPDLSYIGSWGVDEAFLTRWIKNPLEVGTDRTPAFWREHTYGPKVNTTLKAVEPGNTVMPPLPMTDQERADLVKYLMSLKTK